MAIGLWVMFKDATLEQYEAVNAEAGVEENLPEGVIFHAAGPAEGGFSVIDFWESREQFDRFFADRIAPAIEALGDKAPPSPPSIKEFPVHNIIKG
jgi:hypothetical protein